MVVAVVVVVGARVVVVAVVVVIVKVAVVVVELTVELSISGIVNCSVDTLSTLGELSTLTLSSTITSGLY